MERNRSTLVKVALIAAGVVILYWGLNNLSFLGSVLNTIIGILSPFLLGLCIAYVLSVPMRGFEKLLFRPGKKTGKVRLEKLKGPVCLVLSMLTVLVLVGAVMFLVLPELGRTAMTIRDSIPGFITRVQKWSNEVLEKYPEILTTIQSVDWTGIWDDVLTFLKTGVGSFVGSTVGVIGSVFNGARRKKAIR